MSWTSFCISLVLYGFLKDFKPGGPFLFKYQTNFLNLTKKQLNGEIYPYCTYSNLITLIPIFLSTDLLLYKPILILESIGSMIFRILLVFGSGVFTQQIGMAVCGIAAATKIAFCSYIYAKVTKNEYKHLTSWTRAASMAGRTSGYLLSQAIISINIGTYLTVNQIGLISPIIVFIIGISLPRVQWKVLFERIKINNDVQQFDEPKTYLIYVKYRIKKILFDFKQIYGNRFLRKWSLWWALTTCIALQVSSYSQTLWGEVQKEETTLNGLAEAIYTACAAVAIMLMDVIAIDWDKWDEAALVLISSIDCALLLLFSQAQTIYVMYICYICYRTLYQVMITIAQWNLAKKMVSESYGLIFGLNSFVALILQALLTMIVVDKRGFGMTVRSQFLVYGIYHAVIAFIFLFSIACNLTNYLRNRFSNTHFVDLTIDIIKQNVVNKSISWREA
ncbi:Reduced folate carrier family protein [Acanthocheilonema viteae]